MVPFYEGAILVSIYLSHCHMFALPLTSRCALVRPGAGSPGIQQGPQVNEWLGFDCLGSWRRPSKPKQGLATAEFAKRGQAPQQQDLALKFGESILDY